MDLVQGRSARQRNDFVLRLGCWMVTLSMVCSLVIQPPKAKAIVAEASLATSVIWAFMQSAGITFNGTGMNSSSWAEGIEPYLREFTEATDSAAKSFWHWLGYENGAADFIKALSWSKITHPSTMPFPSVTIPPAVAKKLARFTVWFAEKVGLASGAGSITVSSIPGLTGQLVSICETYWSHEDPPRSSLISSKPYRLSFYSSSFDTGPYRLYCAECPIALVRMNEAFKDGGRLLDPGYYLYTSEKPSYGARGLSFVHFDANKQYLTISGSSFVNSRDSYYYHVLPLSADLTAGDSDSAITATQPGALSPTYDDKGEKGTIITIPGLDTEIAGINELLQAILDKLAANELTTSATIAQQPTPEQPDEEKPDLDGLGLPALGTALMTRFPFSIPWDVVRGIKLLAAPAEAPYWEVDFLAPIAGRVGGWKGSTKVVIDMGQYEIIGQLCRWTSTIGFCLVLAAGTKKLIWTA